jgi:hypothetical protein
MPSPENDNSGSNIFVRIFNANHILTKECIYNLYIHRFYLNYLVSFYNGEVSFCTNCFSLFALLSSSSVNFSRLMQHWCKFVPKLFVFHCKTFKISKAFQNFQKLEQTMNQIPKRKKWIFCSTNILVLGGKPSNHRNHTSRSVMEMWVKKASFLDKKNTKKFTAPLQLMHS